MTSLAKALQRLPALGDDMHLRMQATNLGLVDEVLRQGETDLLRAYMESEKTPMPEAVFMSAQSQLWIFGLYELLRTWRQRAAELRTFVAKLQAVPVEARDAWLEEQRAKFSTKSAYQSEFDGLLWAPFVAAAEDPETVEQVRVAVDSSEILFRRIEALRVHLAKHEMPRQHGSRAAAPGYGRIDMLTGSIYWEVSLAQFEVDVVSRQGLSDECLRLGEDRSRFILSPPVQDMVREIPRYSYALRQALLTLDDGTEYPGVHIAWAKEIVGIDGLEEQPFDAGSVVAARPDPEAPTEEELVPPADF